MARSTESPRSIRRWVFFGVAMLIGVICIRLGFWQLDRLQQRRQRNAAIQSSLSLPPIALPEDLKESGGLEYRRARIRGRFLPEDEVYLTNRALDEIAGVHVVTPLRLEAREEVVLVDRGWISDPDYRTRSPSTWSVDGPVEIEGYLLPSQKEPALSFFADRVPAKGEPPLREWRALFIPGIRAQIDDPVLDVYLVREDEPADAAQPIPVSELDLSEGPHLAYALQWFAFAATAAIGGVYWMRRPRR